MQWTKAMKLGWIVLVLALLSACSDHELQPLDGKGPILAFGDSLTRGVGVEKEQSYPAVLARLSGHTVVNAGVSGETTSEGLQRLPELLEMHQPSLLVLLEGGNDILQKVPVEKIEQQLAQMIEIAQKHGVQVLLVGVPEKKLFADAAPWYEALSDRYQIPLEEEIVPDLMGRLSMKSDYVHFNQAGYQALAEAVYTKLQETGAL